MGIAIFWAKIKRAFAFGFGCTLLALGLQGCVLYPAYERPPVETPCSWRLEGDEASGYANAGWWEQLQDPVLNDLIAEALDNNRDLKVAIARVHAFAAQLDIVRSGLYPQISGNLAGLRQESSLFLNPEGPLFPRYYDIFSCLFNATYDLDIWGEIRSASDASLAELLASIETRRTVVLAVVGAVATSYVELRQFDKQLEISMATFKSRQESYDLAVARFVGGLTSELEVKQAEAEMDTAQIQTLQYEISVAEQENLLSVLLGHPPYAIQRGLAVDQFALPPEIPVGLPSELLEQRPDIMAAEERLMAANAQIGVAYAQFFPSISLTGNYGNSSLQLSRLLSSPATTWQFAANLLQPVFTGGRLTAQLAVAQAQKREAFYAYQQAVLTAFQEVNDALIAHKKAKELVYIQKQREQALKEALHLAWLQYDNGQTDYLNVLDVQRNLFSAQLDLAEGESFTCLSLINLYKALGGGWVIQADDTALQAE